MDELAEFEINAGKSCRKKQLGDREKNNYTPKPFKSGLKVNTIESVIIHPELRIPAYTFIEDDSYVECRRIKILED